MNDTAATLEFPSSIALQSTLKNTLCSVLSEDMSTLKLEMLTQEALEVTLRVKGMDPPMLTSTYLLEKGEKGVMVMLGAGQL